MPCSSNAYTLSSILSSVARKLDNILLPAAWTDKSIAVINIASSSRMEHISTTGKRRASTTGNILFHHICVGEGAYVGSGNGANNANNSIVFSTSLLYWGKTTDKKKD